MSPEEEFLPAIPTFADLVEAIESRESHDRPSPSKTGQSSSDRSDGADEDTDDAGSTEDTDWMWDADERTDATDDGPTRTGFSGESTIPEAKSQAMVELIGDAANVLVLGPADTTVDTDVCTTLTAGESPPRAKRILVTTDSSPDERLRHLKGFDRASFDETAIIAVGDQARSTGAGRTINGSNGLTIETLSDPTDLTGLGLRINNHLSEELPTFLCFHSLTGLLQAVDTQKVFRFLHVLRGRIQSSRARAHYHLDPSAHDDETVLTVKPIFDFTIEFEADGSVSIDA